MKKCERNQGEALVKPGSSGGVRERDFIQDNGLGYYMASDSGH